MKSALTILVVFVLVSLTNCGKSVIDDKIPEDFHFTIIDEIDSYNSKNGLFIRKYAGRKDTSVLVKLNRQELDQIYKAVINSNFSNFPDKFNCLPFSPVSLPAFETTIEVKFHNTTKRVTYTTYCDWKVQFIQSQKFETLGSTINKIVQQKTQIHDLNNSDLEFE